MSLCIILGLMKLQHAYYVYILQCKDGSYYTGITNNVERRIEEHNAGIDSKCYTFTRRPVKLLYAEHYQYADKAIQREKQIKGWGRKKKEALMAENYVELIALSKGKR